MLERQYEELARAYERGDLAAMRALRLETFHAALPDGGIAGPREVDENAGQFLAGAEPPITVKFTIRALQVSGDETVAAADVQPPAAPHLRKVWPTRAPPGSGEAVIPGPSRVGPQP